MTTLRSYQVRAVEEVRAAFREARSVCLVAPTGAGKTVLGLEIVRRALEARPDLRVLWIAHRQELIQQAEDRAAEHLGGAAERMEVATVQGLAASGARPKAGLVVYDEAHHYAAGAAQWSAVAQDYAAAWRLGLTATPQRADGTPLGDVFGALVVAAQYSELLAEHHLVPCRVLRPERGLSDGLARDPVEAWMEQAGDRQGFIFARRVEECLDYAERLRARGVVAEVVAGHTPREEREAAISAFRHGRVRVLVSVYVLTEGVDVPQAAVCLLARAPEHASTYLQMVGRVLRPAPGKGEALLIDLGGASWRHGLPTADREYALEGRAIRERGEAEKPTEPVEREDRPLRIYSLELLEVYAGADTPVAAREAEWRRLERLCRARGWGIGWAATQYGELFGVPPDAAWVDRDERYAQIAAWRARAVERGYRPGWVGVMHREAFGTWAR